MSDCIFCKIVGGDIPSDVVFEDDAVFAFRDIHPAAPVHVLVVPKRHVASTDSLADADGPLAGALVLAARDIARRLGVAESGYRLVLNSGADAGQEVFHLHLHVLGGREMGAMG